MKLDVILTNGFGLVLHFICHNYGNMKIGQMSDLILLFLTGDKKWWGYLCPLIRLNDKCSAFFFQK